MGTRNLTCVIKDGEFRVAQYGQWDGYPEAAGRDILNFLNTAGNIDRLRKRMSDVQFVPSAEWTRRLEAAGLNGGITIGSEQERMFEANFWQLDRDIGRKILNLIIASEGLIELDDSREFAHSSLFCEWAYVVDLDRNVLEVYKGFNQDSTADFGVFANVPNTSDTDGYKTVALVKSYPFHNLPTVEVMVEECNPQESEDE